ncbi:hypothetical protein OS493_012315 [Desmophyllum pertusum]|uniref:Uncharacterized protein n=1 Tax=Desmophyllum pertusum TaxID=174260 RepID=A0A9W9ZQK7_9CNID|nr:hypothetical protein OS493_012315 [Desmophyllum pertusum]
MALPKWAGHTGGFYHIVCRHGATVISKPLALQESVRDATDLYLSLKYPRFCSSVIRHVDLLDTLIADHQLFLKSCGEHLVAALSFPTRRSSIHR